MKKILLIITLSFLGVQSSIFAGQLTLREIIKLQSMVNIDRNLPDIKDIARAKDNLLLLIADSLDAAVALSEEIIKCPDIQIYSLNKYHRELRYEIRYFYKLVKMYRILREV